MHERFKIITFYQFKEMQQLGPLLGLREEVRSAMRECSIFGTVIIADEGFNSTVAGRGQDVDRFVAELESIFDTDLNHKASYSSELPFRKIDVKIKPEIVTLKRPVEFSKGAGTQVAAEKWNDLIASEGVFLLDARNDYEYKTGTFEGSVNPGTAKFSDLPAFVEQNLDPNVHKKIAIFCTGGIRCEKFAPYMKGIGFDEVYQLEGGILKYLETVPPQDQKWQGECFVFDARVSVDEKLKKGRSTDHSQSDSGIETEGKER